MCIMRKESGTHDYRKVDNSVDQLEWLMAICLNQIPLLKSYGLLMALSLTSDAGIKLSNSISTQTMLFSFMRQELQECCRCVPW